MPLNGIGDSNLTETVDHVGGGQPDRISQTFYDWRDRPVSSESGIDVSDTTTQRPITYTVYDNLGEATETDQYDGAGVLLSSLGSTSGVPNAPSSSLLRAKTVDSYDDEGRVYLVDLYSVDQGETGGTAGTVGDAIATNTFYDLRGNEIAVYTSGEGATKYAYDGANRVTITSITDGGVINGTTMDWANASNDDGDVVVSQTLYSYDDDGNVILTADKERFDDDATCNMGDLGNPSSGIGARVYYVANYYDAADRLKESLDIGTDAGYPYVYTAGTSISSEATADGSSDTIVDSSLTGTDGTYVGDAIVLTGGPGGGGGIVIAYDASTHTLTYDRPCDPTDDTTTFTLTPIGLPTHTYYDAGGWVADTVDPRGIETEYSRDMLGRTTGLVNAYDFDGSTTRTSSSNQTTDYTFDGNNDVLTETAMMPSGTDNQTTAYIYGIGTTSGTDLFSNDIISTVEYPNASTGDASTAASDDTSYAYDLQGETKTFTDQNGTVHTYDYDPLGRETFDSVAVASGNPQGVDTSVLAQGYSYDTGGRPYQATSYSSADGTGVVNQVQYAYNGFGQEVAEWQNHYTTVNTSTSPEVQYGYSSIDDGSRLTDMIYPNGRQEDYLYDGGSGIDDAISRVTSIADDYDYTGGDSPAPVETYTYLGLDTIVQRADGDGQSLSYIQQPGDTLTSSDGGDQYTGLDRFGRVIDQNWVNTDTDVSTERFQYAYDADGNVLYKDNIIAPSFSELYHANSTTSGDDNSAYDPLNRLTTFRRGTLTMSENNPDISGFVPDTVTTGNLNSTASGNTASWSLDALGNQATANSKNELTGGTIIYDYNGNMTEDGSGNTFVYDAWNRLVTGSQLSSKTYSYDALGRRIGFDLAGSPTTNVDYYYSSDGHDIEERLGGSVTAQYVWSLSGPKTILSCAIA